MQPQEAEIRRDYPKETEGRTLMRDERIVSHADQVKGIDAWYYETAFGVRRHTASLVRAYFVKQDAWAPFWNRDPQKWWFQGTIYSRGESIRRILVMLFEHGLRLDEYRAQGLALQEVIDDYRHRGAKTRKAANALIRLVSYEIFDSLSSVMRRSQKEEFSTLEICQYAWYLSRVLAFDVDTLGDGCDGEGRSLRVLPHFDEDSKCLFIACAILASLDPTSPQNAVMSDGQMRYCKEHMKLQEALDCIRKLGLGFGLFVEMKDRSSTKEQNALSGSGADESAQTFYDLVNARQVSITEDEDAPGGLRIEPVVNAGETGHWTKFGTRSTYLCYVSDDAPKFSLSGFFCDLAKRSNGITILGGYVYSEGDSHDSTSDHDYYWVGGSDVSRHFGLDDVRPAYGDNTTTSVFSVKQFDQWRPYDELYVRISNAYFKVGEYNAARKNEPYRIDTPIYLQLTEGSLEQAHRAIELFVKIADAR